MGSYMKEVRRDGKIITITVFEHNIDDYCLQIRALGLQNSVVLCRESAAAWLGLSDSYVMDSLKVYTLQPDLLLPDFVTDCGRIPEACEYITSRNVYCTTAKQTVLDWLAVIDWRDDVNLSDTLYTYYLRHNKSFNTIIPYLKEQQLYYFHIYVNDLREEGKILF